MRHVVFAALLLLATRTNVAAEPSQRSLSFTDRVKAQEAIERVYYSHQIGTTKPFDQAVPRAVLEARVHKYLDQTVALNVYWKTAVTDEMLKRELERMAEGTLMPERLVEIYTALGNDPFLIKECLARATLVDRLTHNFYAFDPSFHAEERRQSEELHRQLSSGELSPLTEHSNRTVVEYVATESTTVPSRRDNAETFDANNLKRVRRELSQDDFRKQRAELPEGLGRVSAVKEADYDFSFTAVLSETPGELRVASYSVPKRSWDDWWVRAKLSLQAGSVPTVATDGDRLPIPTMDRSVNASQDRLGSSGLPCALDDTWKQTATRPPRPSHHTAVWTGDLMLVWGDNGEPNGPRNGGRYDPATDRWSRMTTEGFPLSFDDHTAVWTGSLMIVWGGDDDQGQSLNNIGGRYDPATDSWTWVSQVGAPSERHHHSAVWTGSSMVVWGGEGCGVQFVCVDLTNTGGRYDPSTDSWTPISTTGAPSARQYHSAVWTGNQMVVWGGQSDSPHYVNTGGRYDPATDTWTPTSTTGAPSGRFWHTAVWTGGLMLAWGGYSGSYLDTGGRYDPATDTWTPTSATGAPSARSRHTAVWTGNQMVVWGGDNLLNSGARYDPATDTWTPTSTTGAPSGRSQHTAVWTGSLMVVWGGQNNYTGGRYDPATDSWTPTTTGPPASSEPIAVWTGSLMLVWGGYTGMRYDPATDTWTPTATAGAPSARSRSTSVWTGDRMVLWGGSFLNSGARYDPATDTWTPTSTTGAPSGRSQHTAVWTGSLMVVWGGQNVGGQLNTGGRYDPATDTWTPTSTTGVPSARGIHTAVWTGSLMLVWGGMDDSDLDTGGRYNPATDLWTPTSTTSAPSGRHHHSAVWTGSSMVVWGGNHDGVYNSLNSGARYDPATDTWTPTSTTGAPSERSQHTAVWTGSLMVVWGGANDFIGTNTGGRYDPPTDTWTPTSTLGAPDARFVHIAVWTGTEMIVWGGEGDSDDGLSKATGGRYVVAPSIDNDNDGTTVCGGDCDDTHASVYPAAPEICDGLDNNCNGPVDEDANGVDNDGDGVHNACDNCIFDWNGTQTDFNHDGEGDLCDLNDGLIYVYATDKNYREWQAESGYAVWRSYRGSLAALRATGQYTQAPGSNPLAARDCGLTDVYVFDAVVPAPGAVAFNLVTGVVGGVESSLGTNSAGVPRANANPCP